MSKKIVAFKASWCGPCKALQPTLEEIKEEGHEVMMVDVDEDSELAQQHGIRSVPTMVLLEDGTEVHRLIGNQPKQTILEHLS